VNPNISVNSRLTRVTQACLGLLPAPELEQYQRQQQEHTQAEQRSTHGTVHRLQVPRLEHCRVVHRCDGDQREARQRLNRIGEVAPIAPAMRDHRTYPVS
jgi:hypothetical protein